MMKRFAIIMFMVLAACHLSVTFAQKIDAKTQDHMKAIVAIELNYISLKESQQKIAALQKIDTDSLKFSQVLNFASLPQNNVDLVKHIQNFKIKVDSTPEITVNKYLDTLFSTNKIQNFFNNKKDRNINESKKKISERLIAVLASDDEEQAIDNTDEAKAFETANIAQEKTASDNKSGEETPAVKKKVQAEKSKMLTYLPLFIIILLIGGCIYFFFALKKESEKYFNTFKKYKEADKENRTLHDEVENLKTENARLNEVIETNLQKYQRLHNEYLKIRSASPNSYLSKSEQDGNNARNSATKLNTQATSKMYMGPKELYAQMPNNSLFDNVQKHYDPNESMYVISTSDGESGRFSFIDDVTAVNIAQNARDMFIESACIILNDEKREFDHIRTITPGTVVNTQYGWKITKKAEVELV